MRKTIRGTVIAVTTALILAVSASTAFADPSGPPTLTESTSSSVANAYISYGGGVLKTWVDSCDTAADGHHTWAEIQFKLASASWVAPNPGVVSSVSATDYNGKGTCSGYSYFLGNGPGTFDFRVVTYTMEGDKVIAGPNYSYTLVISG